MRRCIELAAKGEGKVSPNPLVGAVVVKNGRIISEGFHEKFGSPHAEANALRGINAAGATLYVSLEPCSHCGGEKKTPPCAPLVISSGVSRVVIATKDPNPCVDGCGIAQLRAAGIKVDVGVMGKEAQEQNAAFFKCMKTCKPFVLVKLAQSKDGKIGVRGKGKVWLSGRQFDSYCHAMRNRYDAILVGVNTVINDDPQLTCRMKGGRNPVRIILDSRLRIPLSARVLQHRAAARCLMHFAPGQNAHRNAKKDCVLIFTTQGRDRAKEKALGRLGASVIVCGKGNVDLKKLVSLLPAYGVYSVLVEGGAQTIGSFIRAKLADRLVLAISPEKIGDARAVSSPITPAVLRSLKGVRKEKMGKDTVIEGKFKS